MDTREFTPYRSSWRMTRLLSGVSVSPRQFEYHPSIPNLAAIGTLQGEVLVHDMDADQTKAYHAFAGKHFMDNTLGLCWLRSEAHAHQFMVGNGQGGIHLATLGGRSPESAEQHGNLRLTPINEFESLTSVHVSADDAHVVASGYSNDVTVYSMETGAVVRTWENAHTAHINLARFGSRHAAVFATSSFDGTMKLWDMRQAGGAVMTLSTLGPLVMLAFNAQDTRILTSGVDNRVAQYSTASGNVEWCSDADAHGSSNHVYTRSYYMGPASDAVISGSSEEAVLRVRSAQNGEHLCSAALWEAAQYPGAFVQSLRGHPLRAGEGCVLLSYMQPAHSFELVRFKVPATAAAALVPDADSEEAVAAACASDPAGSCAMLAMPSLHLSADLWHAAAACSAALSVDAESGAALREAVAVAAARLGMAHVQVPQLGSAFSDPTQSPFACLPQAELQAAALRAKQHGAAAGGLGSGRADCSSPAHEPEAAGTERSPQPSIAPHTYDMDWGFPVSARQPPQPVHGAWHRLTPAAPARPGACAASELVHIDAAYEYLGMVVLCVPNKTPGSWTAVAAYQPLLRAKLPRLAAACPARTPGTAAQLAVVALPGWTYGELMTCLAWAAGHQLRLTPQHIPLPSSHCADFQAEHWQFSEYEDPGAVHAAAWRAQDPFLPVIPPVAGAATGLADSEAACKPTGRAESVAFVRAIQQQSLAGRAQRDVWALHSNPPTPAAPFRPDASARKYSARFAWSPAVHSVSAAAQPPASLPVRSHRSRQAEFSTGLLQFELTREPSGVGAVSTGAELARLQQVLAHCNVALAASARAGLPELAQAVDARLHDELDAVTAPTLALWAACAGRQAVLHGAAVVLSQYGPQILGWTWPACLPGVSALSVVGEFLRHAPSASPAEIPVGIQAWLAVVSSAVPALLAAGPRVDGAALQLPPGWQAEPRQPGLASNAAHTTRACPAALLPLWEGLQRVVARILLCLHEGAVLVPRDCSCDGLSGMGDNWQDATIVGNFGKHRQRHGHDEDDEEDEGDQEDLEAIDTDGSEPEPTSMRDPGAASTLDARTPQAALAPARPEVVAACAAAASASSAAVLPSIPAAKLDWLTAAASCVARSHAIPALSGHTATAISHDRILILGGEHELQSLKPKFPLICWHNTGAWSPAVTRGDMPPSLSMHCTCPLSILSNSRHAGMPRGTHPSRWVVVFGGQGQWVPQGMVYILDTEAMHWTALLADVPVVGGTLLAERQGLLAELRAAAQAGDAAAVAKLRRQLDRLKRLALPALWRHCMTPITPGTELQFRVTEARGASVPGVSAGAVFCNDMPAIPGAVVVEQASQTSSYIISGGFQADSVQQQFHLWVLSVDTTVTRTYTATEQPGMPGEWSWVRAEHVQHEASAASVSPLFNAAAPRDCLYDHAALLLRQDASMGGTRLVLLGGTRNGFLADSVLAITLGGQPAAQGPGSGAAAVAGAGVLAARYGAALAADVASPWSATSQWTVSTCAPSSGVFVPLSQPAATLLDEHSGLMAGGHGPAGVASSLVKVSLSCEPAGRSVLLEVQYDPVKAHTPSSVGGLAGLCSGLAKAALQSAAAHDEPVSHVPVPADAPAQWRAAAAHALQHAALLRACSVPLQPARAALRVSERLPAALAAHVAASVCEPAGGTGEVVTRPGHRPWAVLTDSGPARSPLEAPLMRHFAPLFANEDTPFSPRFGTRAVLLPPPPPSSCQRTTTLEDWFGARLRVRAGLHDAHAAASLRQAIQSVWLYGGLRAVRYRHLSLRTAANAVLLHQIPRLASEAAGTPATPAYVIEEQGAWQFLQAQVSSRIYPGDSGSSSAVPSMLQAMRSAVDAKDAVCFVCAGGDAVYVHKHVAGSRSEYMQRRFAAAPGLAQLDVAGSSAPAVRALAQWWYTDLLPVGLDPMVVIEALGLALKWGEARFARLAEGWITAALSVDNAAGLLSFADMHQADALAAAVETFILREFHAVASSPAWAELPQRLQDRMAALWRHAQHAYAVDAAHVE